MLMQTRVFPRKHLNPRSSNRLQVFPRKHLNPRSSNRLQVFPRKHLNPRSTRQLQVSQMRQLNRPSRHNHLANHRVKGRDGKSYRAQRRTAPQMKPATKEKAQWAELATILGELAQKVETLVPTPEENEKPWELISSLEKTAQSLLRQAQRLRRRHHL